MKHTYEEKTKKLKISLDEDIDMNSCRTLRTIVDGYIMRYSPNVFEMDMASVKFMDSSGLGFIMGRYALAQKLGGRVSILNPGKRVEKIISLAGLERIIKIERTNTK